MSNRRIDVSVAKQSTILAELFTSLTQSISKKASSYFETLRIGIYRIFISIAICNSAFITSTTYIHHIIYEISFYLIAHVFYIRRWDITLTSYKMYIYQQVIPSFKIINISHYMSSSIESIQDHFDSETVRNEVGKSSFADMSTIPESTDKLQENVYVYKTLSK